MPFLRFNCSCWILEMRIMRNTFRMITIILRKFSFHLLFIPCNLNHSNCLQNIATLLCTELSFTTTPPLRPQSQPNLSRSSLWSRFQVHITSSIIIRKVLSKMNLLLYLCLYSCSIFQDLYFKINYPNEWKS